MVSSCGQTDRRTESQTDHRCGWSLYWYSTHATVQPLAWVIINVGLRQVWLCDVTDRPECAYSWNFICSYLTGTKYSRITVIEWHKNLAKETYVRDYGTQVSSLRETGGKRRGLYSQCFLSLMYFLSFSRWQPAKSSAGFYVSSTIIDLFHVKWIRLSWFNSFDHKFVYAILIGSFNITIPYKKSVASHARGQCMWPMPLAPKMQMGFSKRLALSTP